MRQNKTFIFVHIPKTAGTSLKAHFQAQLKDDEEFIHFANVGFNIANKKGLKPYYDRPEASRSKAKVILGHKVNYKTKLLVNDNRVEEVVIFRDPISWEISRFNQQANRLYKQKQIKIDFTYWLTHVDKTHSQFDWFLSNYLMLGPSINKISRQAKENLLFFTLSHFQHVFFLESMHDSLKGIFNQLGIGSINKHENAVGKQKKQFFENTKANHALVKKTCEHEIETYKKLMAHFNSAAPNSFGQ